MIKQNVEDLLNSLPKENCFGEKITLVAATKTRTVEEINEAISAGIRKINIATDLCYAFANCLKENDPLLKPLDISLSLAADWVKDVAIDRIKVFGADKYRG